MSDSSEPCTCEERQLATARGHFLLSRTHEGWIFLEGPMRRMSPMAAYYGNERGVMNHTGEPYTWVTCPWCAGDLSPPENWLHTQCDGDDGN